ncbi:MAG: sugar phosphate isomerase/epimerase family protein [Ginsengibacter sp.]|jgi:sugar phosphate isomerase/epimerase
MTTSRRTFIKNSSLALAGVSMLPSILKEEKTSVIVGIQLYTVRDDMRKDPAGTLKKLAAMGYKYVEHAGYHDGKFYGYSIPEFKKLLKQNNLKMESGHSPLTAKDWNKTTNDFTDEWKQTITDAAAVGMKYLISPGVDESLCKTKDDFMHYMDMFNKTGALCKKAGIHFAFHNESYEFNHSLGGTALYDLILQTVDKNVVDQQMDIGNMWEPGGRPLHYLKKYPRRFLLMHVKNELKRETAGANGNLYENTLLSKGVIPVKEVIDYARKTGTKYFIIEQEEYQDKTPLECAELDLKAMKGWGF